MDAGINTKEADWTCYIAPDESYFIFCSFRKGGFGSGDLYVCFKEKNGSWSKPINMGDKINTNLNERFPNVTPDGKYLFFNSTKKIQGAASDSPGNGYGDMYWISAKIIDELKMQAKIK
jgi:Tol biopolymer transport system component